MSTVLTYAMEDFHILHISFEEIQGQNDGDYLQTAKMSQLRAMKQVAET